MLGIPNVTDAIFRSEYIDPANILGSSVLRIKINTLETPPFKLMNH